jgi:hypothetical protein
MKLDMAGLAEPTNLKRLGIVVVVALDGRPA